MERAEKVIVCCSDKEISKDVADALKKGGVNTVCVSGGGEAIKILRKNACDMLIVGTEMSPAPSGTINFLGKAREFVPKVLRALLKEGDLTGDIAEIINKAAPCAVFENPINVGQLKALIESHRKIMNSEEPVQNTDTSFFRTRISELEIENFKLVQRLGGSSAVAAAEAADAKKKGKSLGSLLGASLDQGDSPQGIDHLRHPKAPGFTSGKRIEPRVQEIIDGLDLLMAEPDVRLPVLPNIGMEIQQMAKRDDVSFNEIVAKITLDPSLSARILEVANSPLYSRSKPATSIESAVTRVGIHETLNIIQAVVAESTFKTDDKTLKMLVSRLWMHSLTVAYSNEILAKALCIEESQDFFMMGLLHDVGKQLIIHLIEQAVRRGMWQREDFDEELILKVFDAHHNKIGLQLMQKWNYPDAYQKVVNLHNNDDEVYKYEDPVVVTYYSNVLSRKMGYSLKPHNEAVIANKQIAQALNMSDDARAAIMETLEGMIDEIKASYLK